MTSCAGVNATLADLLDRVRGIAGGHLFGMYLYGSLASGDFDPARSDIDFLVVTDGELPDCAARSTRSNTERSFRSRPPAAGPSQTSTAAGRS